MKEAHTSEQPVILRMVNFVESYTIYSKFDFEYFRVCISIPLFGLSLASRFLNCENQWSFLYFVFNE